MIAFGSGTSAASTAAIAAREAAAQALGVLGGVTPKLAIVFASVLYADVGDAARAVRGVVGDAQILGGTSGGSVFAGEHVTGRGVSVILLGGDGIEVESRTAALASPSCMEAVPVSQEISRAADRAAARGFGDFACLVFAPGVQVDGEALVAAVRKGAGAHAQLAGGLTGDEFLMVRPKVFFGDELRDDCVIITGIFTKVPLGIGARHGWVPVGPVRTVTRTEGAYLLELDERPALEVWLEDAKRAGATPPSDPKELVLYLANHYELGLASSSSRVAIADDPREMVARAPFAVREDGGVLLSATIPEGGQVRVMHATGTDLVRAAGEAATAAVTRAGGSVAGALVLSCSSRLAALGAAFGEEMLEIRRRIEGPIGGACVYGEIARNVRDMDAFFNSTVVVIAFPR